jgi:hypothetical protein
MSNNSNLFLSICKPIKDEYGRVIGKLASFALTPSGKFDAVFIEFNDGQFSKQPMENLKFDGSEILFISKTKSQAVILCDQIPLIWRKDQALRDLSEKRKISPELYQELHNSFDGVLNQLKKDAKVIVDEAAVDLARCEEQIRTLSYAIVNLEIEHEIGQVNEANYSSAFAMLQENLKRVVAEKSDIELTRSKLSNILLGDSIQAIQKKITAEPITEALELPEPPVVVYVKEIGKAGI